MNNIDSLYEVSEIKNQFERLQKKYQTQLPKVDPYLVYDLLLRQQKNPATIYMYNIEVFTKHSIDTNAAKEHIYKKTDMVPAVYDKGTHYVINQKLTLEILKGISDCEEVLQISGEYTGCCCSASMGTSHELRNQRNSSKYSFYGGEDMFLDYITYIIPSAHRELVAWMKYREESGAIKTNIIAKGMQFPKIEEGR